MHALRLRAALRKWDEVMLGEALGDVVIDVTGQPCPTDVEHDLSWACRDLLWSVRQWPFPRSATTPVNGVALLVTYTLHTRPHKRLELRIGSKDEELRRRLIEVGLDLHPVDVSRDEVSSPPWQGEPGFTPSPSPHIVPVVPAPHQTYAHALAVMERLPPGRFYARWNAGQVERVWADIGALGEQARDDERQLADIMHVVTGTLQRCAQHLRTLTRLLAMLGLSVEPPQADPMALERIARFEAQVGPLPLTICAWYHIVGAIDLRGFGTEDELASWAAPHVLGTAIERADPLVIEPSATALEHDDTLWWQGRYPLRMGPDTGEKFFSYGGPPLAVMTPSAAVDGQLRGESFLHYVRRCLAWAGYPEVDVAPLREMRARPGDF